ncbi:MAG: hypothetical protein ABW279_12830 [Acidimicrobiales bacterium]
MAGDELIEAYLQRLDRRLAPMGRVRRDRIVTETRDHLLEAAAVDGVDQALARFGTPAVVAGAHLEGQARARTLWALGTLAVAGLVYGAIGALASPAAFGLFPGGPWPDDVPPSYLAWKVDVASSFVAAAAACGALALLLRWRDRRDLDRSRSWVLRLSFAGSVLLLAGLPLETIFLFQRGNNVAGSPPGWAVTLVCLGYLISGLIALAVTGRALLVDRGARTASAEA